MLIGDMGITRLIIHVQQHKQKEPASLSASAPAPRNKCEYNSQNFQNFKVRLRIRKVEGHKWILRLLHVLSVVGATQLLYQIGRHLNKLLQGQAEKETVFMLSLVVESKMIRQMLSLV
ncbi:hypothetical protein MTR67_030236 [Solanum verrucosum]|uniref:Uncharacterized protein n=1 Tax=Solanum verrucosum TaxID=315347 RepID=A0AAF0RDP1_SOLVR|nr:hypothetical protein MTR67_030236 [Solanum verrucosum]